MKHVHRYVEIKTKTIFVRFAGISFCKNNAKLMRKFSVIAISDSLLPYSNNDAKKVPNCPVNFFRATFLQNFQLDFLAF